MSAFHFSAEFVKRFSAFFSSVKNTEVPGYSKSEYWQEHSKLINVSVSDRTVTVSGCAGYYIPPRIGSLACLRSMIKDTIYPFIKRCRGGIQLLSYSEAFDAIMGNKPVAELFLGPQRVDFGKLYKDKQAVLSVKEIRTKYFAKEKYRINEQVINSYYLWNILSAQIPVESIKTVLEIGPGNGNLSALLHHQLKARVICVDLPETLCLSIPFIADCFPDARILMPHEADSAGKEEYDFIFLTPRQIHRVPDNSVDLMINTDSFQEMTAKQIEEYFKLIQRVSRNGGYFLTQNRVEKFLSQSDSLPSSEFVSRFCYYPWQQQNETVIYQICPLGRLVQLDDAFIRLEKILK